MKQKIYQIDAFTDRVFAGNPAAVCILDQWLPDELMQEIASENNLAETAFALKLGTTYELRWFTPKTEVDLCGHATLATAFVLYHFYGHDAPMIHFISPRSGELFVEKEEDGRITMDFPVNEFFPVEQDPRIKEIMGTVPLEIYKGKTDFMLIYASQKDIEEIDPDLHLMKDLDCRGIIVTAKGKDVDFVSRFFAPKLGIPEDPVTGSAHTTLVPYWSNKLQKTILNAKQISHRGGFLQCEYLGERVKISGHAVCYLEGHIMI